MEKIFLLLGEVSQGKKTNDEEIEAESEILTYDLI